MARKRRLGDTVVVGKKNLQKNQPQRQQRDSNYAVGINSPMLLVQSRNDGLKLVYGKFSKSDEAGKLSHATTS